MKPMTDDHAANTSTYYASISSWTRSSASCRRAGQAEPVGQHHRRLLGDHGTPWASTAGSSEAGAVRTVARAPLIIAAPAWPAGKAATHRRFLDIFPTLRSWPHPQPTGCKARQRTLLQDHLRRLQGRRLHADDSPGQHHGPQRPHGSFSLHAVGRQRPMELYDHAADPNE